MARGRLSGPPGNPDRSAEQFEDRYLALRTGGSARRASVFEQPEVRRNVVSEVIEHVGIDGGDRFAVVEPFVMSGDRVLDIGKRNPRSGPALRTDNRDLREV